jgi:hypothetical protein
VPYLSAAAFAGPNAQECTDTYNKMDDLINRDKRAAGNSGTHGLKHRFAEQIYGQNGPGTTSWQNHEDQIRGQQVALGRSLRKYEKLKCNKLQPQPKDAYVWETRPPPSAVQWNGPSAL